MRNRYKTNSMILLIILSLFIPAQSFAKQLHYLTNPHGEIVIGVGKINDLAVIENGGLLIGTNSGLYVINPNDFSIDCIAFKDRNVKTITLACQGELAVVECEDAIDATCLVNWDTGEIIHQWIGDSIESMFSKDGSHLLISCASDHSAEIVDVNSLDSIALNHENVIQFVDLDSENHLVSWIEGEKIANGYNYEINDIYYVTWDYLENKQEKSTLLEDAKTYMHEYFDYWENQEFQIIPGGCFESAILCVIFRGQKLISGYSLCCWNKITGESISLNTDLSFIDGTSFRISCDGQWLIVNNGPVGSIDIGRLTDSVLDYKIGPFRRYTKIAMNSITDDPFVVGALLMDNVYIHGIHQYDSSDNTYPSSLLMLKNTPIQEMSAAFSPQNRLAVLQYDSLVEEYDLLQSGNCSEFYLSQYVPDLTYKGSVDYSRDGSKFVRGYGNRASVWIDSTTSTDRFVQSATSDRRTHATFDRSGERFLTASGNQDAPGVDNLIRIWDAETFEMQREIRGHSDSVWCAEFSPDDRQIVSASLDGTAKVWDVESGAMVCEFVGHATGVEYAAFMPDGGRVMSVGRDRRAFLWDAETAEVERTFEDIHLPAQLSTDGKHLFAGSEVWDVETGERIKTLDGVEQDYSCLTLSPDGTMLLTSEYEGFTKVWNVQEHILKPSGIWDFEVHEFTPSNPAIGQGGRNRYKTLY